MINTRIAEVEDSESLSDFVKHLDQESDFLLYDPGERKNDVSVIKSYLLRMKSDKKSVVYIAENECQKVIGFVCGEVSHLNRLSHVMKANIGVLKKYHGCGLGRLLTDQLVKHAKSVGIVRIEVTVIEENKISLNLCKKFGFEIEGVKTKSMKIGGRYYNEYFLAMLIC